VHSRRKLWAGQAAVVLYTVLLQLQSSESTLVTEHAFSTDLYLKLNHVGVCAGSPWRVAVQNAGKVGVAGSGIRQALVGRTAQVDVTGCKTPATVTVLCE